MSLPQDIEHVSATSVSPADETHLPKLTLICEKHGVFAVFHTALCTFCAREKREEEYRKQKDV